MKQSAILYLASGSRARQLLLKHARIPFTVIAHAAQEESVPWDVLPEVLVRELSLLKMEYALLPVGREGDSIYVLTADTVTFDKNGVIYGKPATAEEVLVHLRQLEGRAFVATGFCIEKKSFKGGLWETVGRNVGVVKAECVYTVPQKWLNDYLSIPEVFTAAGSLTIEGYGALFIKAVYGSPSGIMGLPLYEVREALEELGFFF